MTKLMVESFMDNILRNAEKDALFNLYSEFFKLLEKLF